MSIIEFLTWLGTAGGASVALAFILERVEPFQMLSVDVKSYVVLGGTIAIALGSYAILTYVPANILEVLAPWFKIVAGCVAAWLASQVAHKVDPRAK